MNKLTSGVFASLFAIGMIGVANAGESKGAYINVAAGQSQFASSATTPTFQDNPQSFALSLGYQMSSSWAIEAGYVDLGNPTDLGVQMKCNATVLSAVKSWNISDTSEDSNFSILVKVGIAQTKTTNDIATPTSYKKRGAAFGIGGNYDVDENWSIRVEADSFDTGSDVFGRVPVYLIGMGYKF